MANELTKLNQLKNMLSMDSTKQRFTEIMGKKAPAFISSVLQVVSNNSYLQNADPTSVMASAAIAATLDLSINPNLGFAAIIPFNDRQKGQVAQIQIMVKGFKQLAMRSGQYLALNDAIVYEGQLVKEDPFKGEYEFDYYAKKSDKVIGYMAYFKLVNGFEKYFYMTKEQVEAHGKKYSQTYKKGFGIWKDDFDAMALKTVTKLLLSKYGILSIEMERAITFDQSTIKGDITNVDVNELEPEYIDNSKKSDLGEIANAEIIEE